LSIINRVILLIVNLGHEALDSLKGPAPSIEAYANYQVIAPPTVLRSERQQAGKKEYLTGCAKLQEILENTFRVHPCPPCHYCFGTQGDARGMLKEKAR
ncbi:uncharacterized protein VP01_8949g1, partial [Puccinia sorghi]